MIKFCKYAWDQNESELRKVLKESEPDFLRECTYKKSRISDRSDYIQ